MRLLLDTHVVLWLLSDSDRLPVGWLDAVASAEEAVLSAAVGWEIAVKRSLGRLDAPDASELVDVLVAAGYRQLPVTWQHATASAELPWHHRDPFDRLLVAQARCEDLVLASVDERVRAYDVELLEA